eukprot:TRINITY_DN19344_c0_g1_i1.p1 TRINITY_DN19344_c0_g1~~TRINITY_DN19344_c0_g1_i1.p1  ORF type:complete len:459 (+),score=127.63 TRINITY_DN19344_c0_g1_i1:44-1378(+)
MGRAGRRRGVFRGVSPGVAAAVLAGIAGCCAAGLWVAFVRRRSGPLQAAAGGVAELRQQRRELLAAGTQQLQSSTRLAGQRADGGRRPTRQPSQSLPHESARGGGGKSRAAEPRRAGGGKKPAESHGAGGRPAAESDSIVALGTTLKPCSDGDAVWIRQMSAVASWREATEDVHIFGDESGTAALARAAGVHKHSVAASGSGAPLLGALFGGIEQHATAPVLGYVNGDIILPSQALLSAVRLARETFTEFFAIGHRSTVDGVRDVPRSGGWVTRLVSDLPKRADRTDAEDYFLWTRGFFGDAKKLPPFRIGRPAYDNWLVNRALKSGKPVIDLTEAVPALHQRHDYAHLKSKGGSTGKRYWDTDDQQRNYALGREHGGWQFGLIEFAPWQVAPKGCGRRCVEDGEDCTGGCRIVWRDDWRPLKGSGKTVPEFKASYQPYMRRPQ